MGKHVRARRLVALGAAITAFGSGCFWSQPGHGPGHTRHNPTETALTIDNVATLTPVWSTALPEADQSGSATEPIIADGRAYVGRQAYGPAGGVWAVALDAGDGAIEWQRQLYAGNASLVWPSPNARSGDTLSVGYAGLVDGACGADHGDLDPDDGTGTLAGDGRQVSPAVTSGALVARTSIHLQGPSAGCTYPAPTVEVAETATGAVRWSATLAPGSGGDLPTFMPAVGSGRVVVADSAGLHSFALAGCGAATCEPLWSVGFDAGITWTTPPVVTGSGQALVTTDTGTLVALDVVTGAELWRADLAWRRGPLSPLPGLAAAGGLVYVSSPSTDQPGTGTVRAFAAGGCGSQTCAPLWSTSVGGTPSAPAVAGGVVYVAAGDQLHGYDAAGCGAAECSPVATAEVPPYAQWVTVAGGRAYVASRAHVTALAPS